MSINNKRSYTEYTVVQPTTDFAIGFDDFDEGGKDNILVTLNGVLVESLGYAAIRKNESTVTITPAITEGTVRLTRETDIDEPFHKFTAGALFSAKSMDENFQQVRHSQQEVRDGFVFLEYNTNGIVQASKVATAQAKAATVEATASAVRAEVAADTAVQAVGSLQGVVDAATTATNNANNATATATTAASQATAATTSAQNAAQAATVAKQEAAAATANANAATVDTLAATGRANEAADVVADLVVGKVRAQDVSTSDGSTQDVKNTEFRSELEALPIIDGKVPSAKVNYLSLAVNSVLRDLQSRLGDVVSVKDFGAKGDGVTDDTNSFRLAIAECIKLGRKLYIPNPEVEYLITSTLEITEFTQIEGESGALISQYIGRQKGGTRIRYTGTGACFEIKYNTTPTTLARLAFGVAIKRLIISGTPQGSHGVKVSDPSAVTTSGSDLAGFQCEDLFIYGFFEGVGLEVNFTFNNKITNLVVETCGTSCRLNYAHNTTFVGGSLEQSLLGLDVRYSFDVNLHGTIYQGLNTALARIWGLKIPLDTYVWGGWDGTGSTGVSRTVPQDYAGVGMRNLGSIVSIFGGYEEATNTSYVLELDSSTSVFGRYVDFDAGGAVLDPSKHWVQIGIGAFTAHGCTFLQGGHPEFVGVFHTERNYAAPFSAIGNNFPETMLETKHFTGTQGHVGTVEDFLPSKFKSVTTHHNTDVVFKGGYQREMVETVPTSSGNSVVDFSVGTKGVNFLHVTTGTSLFIELLDPNRRKEGTPLRIAIINSGTAAIPVTFKDNSFLVAQRPVSIPSGNIRVFTFIFLNGAFVEEGVNIPL